MRAFAAALLIASLPGASALAADDNQVGQRFSIASNALPKPHATPAVANSSLTIPRPNGAVPNVPPGFRANLFAGGLHNPRWLAIAPNGDVFVTEPDTGKITVLRDADG